MYIHLYPGFSRGHRGSGYPALISSLHDDTFSSSSDEAPTSFSMTYNDDNIDDNVSEKPVDYSQRYREQSYENKLPRK